jgi:DNA polymerase III delta prime subunit
VFFQTLKLSTQSNILVWAEEDYQRLVHDLQKCQKLKKESDSATVEYTSKPTLAKEGKANAAKEHYEQQLRMCNGEMDKARKIRKHHTNCLKLMVAMHVSSFLF